MENNVENVKKCWPEIFQPYVVKLKNGSYFVPRYDKYDPLLSFILNEDSIETVYTDIDVSGLDINIHFDAKKVEWMSGSFHISNKGTRCFTPTESGDHILIRTEWGGAFNQTRGNEYWDVKTIPECCHHRRAQSRGGGYGFNYYIFPKNFKREISIDEI